MSEPIVECLETRVRNATGKTAFFGFLPPHGRRLSAGEVFRSNVPFQTLLAGITKQRQREAFLDAIRDGSLRLLSTPSPVIYDPVTEEAKTLTVTGGVVGSADACWGYASSGT